MSTNQYATISAILPVRQRILSSHGDLMSACIKANLTLDEGLREFVDKIDRPYAYRNAEAGDPYVRPCTEAYVVEDGGVWYVTEGELMLFHRLPVLPGPSPTHYGLAYITGDSVEFYGFAFPDDLRGRDILRAIQCGLNRPIAYYHAPRANNLST